MLFSLHLSDISAGEEFSIFRWPDNTVKAAGKNQFGKLGTGQPPASSSCATSATLSNNYDANYHSK